MRLLHILLHGGSQDDLCSHDPFPRRSLLFPEFLVLSIPQAVIDKEAERDRTTGPAATSNEPMPAILGAFQIHPLDHGAQCEVAASAAEDEKCRACIGGHAGARQQDGVGSGQPGEDVLGLVEVLERDALDAGLDVVLGVHVGVNHVVQYGPGDVGRVQQRGRREGPLVGEQVDAQGREAHDGAPGKGQAEHGLRVVGDALGERVQGDEHQARNAVE